MERSVKESLLALNVPVVEFLMLYESCGSIVVRFLAK
jgi:hypothetical protein